MIRSFARIAVAFALALAAITVASANENPFSYLSTASNNSTLVAPGPQLLRSVLVSNTTTTTYYLKIYDKLTAPTCGTDTPKMRVPIPPQSAGGGGVMLSFSSLQFTFGVGFCLTAGIADSDNTNAATGVAINFTISQL